jgi:hypothetical protein
MLGCLCVLFLLLFLPSTLRRDGLVLLLEALSSQRCVRSPSFFLHTRPCLVTLSALGCVIVPLLTHNTHALIPGKCAGISGAVDGVQLRRADAVLSLSVSGSAGTGDCDSVLRWEAIVCSHLSQCVCVCMCVRVRVSVLRTRHLVSCLCPVRCTPSFCNVLGRACELCEIEMDACVCV